MRLSHSGKSTYVSCSEKYRLHYIEKLRSPKLYSSLFFGSALDEAFSRLLLDKKLIKTEEESAQLSLTPEQIFREKMERVESNGKIVEVAKSPYADYYSSDFTPDLLTDEAVEKIYWFAPDLVDVRTDESSFREYARKNILTFMDECKAVIKAKKKLSVEDLPLFNYITWLTLVEKGLLMIEAYRTQIMPQIFEVYSIQERITLKNEPYTATRRVYNSELGEWAEEEYETCDELTGLIDFTCSFTDDPGTMYVCDNKTSSKPYKASETAASAQLATYCEYKGTNKAAYVVIEKTVFKKAPVIHTQILRDSIPEATFADTFAQFENVLHNINTGAFEKNFKSCFEYGRLCVYYALCKHNNADGLIDMNASSNCKTPAPSIEEENVEV